jgi:23S rRNA (uridine2552-2'-O)-methyltransferase
MTRGTGGSRHLPGRRLAMRVKTAKGRSASSQRWLKRQLNDPYVAEAKRRGYRSRAAFKLIEIDDRLRILKPGQRVVDLGAAPGGWTQVAVERVKPGEGRNGQVVALDLVDMAPVPGATILKADFLDVAATDLVRRTLGGPLDVVLSDLAPAATGQPETDHVRILNLVEAALFFAVEMLRPGGAFVAKLRQGGGEPQLVDAARRHFSVVRRLKPAASRTESAEFFLVATGFKGAT